MIPAMFSVLTYINFCLRFGTKPINIGLQVCHNESNCRRYFKSIKSTFYSFATSFIHPKRMKDKMKRNRDWTQNVRTEQMLLSLLSTMLNNRSNSRFSPYEFCSQIFTKFIEFGGQSIISKSLTRSYLFYQKYGVPCQNFVERNKINRKMSTAAIIVFLSEQ